MDEETLNISLRKFLKNVGINSQRLIEEKVRSAVQSSQISSSCSSGHIGSSLQSKSSQSIYPLLSLSIPSSQIS